MILIRDNSSKIADVQYLESRENAERMALYLNSRDATHYSMYYGKAHFYVEVV